MLCASSQRFEDTPCRSSFPIVGLASSSVFFELSTRFELYLPAHSSYISDAMMPVRSLLHPRLALETPHSEELPPYSPPARHVDPETASIRSEAPSYRSEAPPYSPPSNGNSNDEEPEQQYGLPALERYAPGFQSRPHGSVADIQNHNYNMGNWSSIRTGHRTREYENVARRRVQRDPNVSQLLNSLSAVPAPTPMSATGSAAALMIAEISEASARTYPNASTRARPSAPSAPAEEPFSPLEDPTLVGEVAAARAKSSRLYRENAMRDPLEALRNENKKWDFMLAQMKDWDEREQSWNNFRRDLNGGRRLKLARRIGFKR